MSDSFLMALVFAGLAAAVVLVIVGWRHAEALGKAAESRARAAGEPSYSQAGGARLDLFNATIPFARIVATPSKLTLVVLGREYVFEGSQVQSLARYRGLFSTGLRIEHSRRDVPSWVVFWTTNYAKLAQALRQLGYRVTEGE